MKAIIIMGDIPFTDDQKARLDALGEVKVKTECSSSSEWLSAVEGADVIVSDGDYLLENLEKIKALD